MLGQIERGKPFPSKKRGFLPCKTRFSHCKSPIFVCKSPICTRKTAIFICKTDPCNCKTGFSNCKFPFFICKTQNCSRKTQFCNRFSRHYRRKTAKSSRENGSLSIPSEYLAIGLGPLIIKIIAASAFVHFCNFNSLSKRIKVTLSHSANFFHQSDGLIVVQRELILSGKYFQVPSKPKIQASIDESTLPYLKNQSCPRISSCTKPCGGRRSRFGAAFGNHSLFVIRLAGLVLPIVMLVEELRFQISINLHFWPGQYGSTGTPDQFYVLQEAR